MTVVGPLPERINEVATATTKDKQKENIMTRSLWLCPIRNSLRIKVFYLYLMVIDAPSPLLDESLPSSQDNGTRRVWILHCREHSKSHTYIQKLFLYFEACMQECQMAEPVNVCINSRDFLLKKKKCEYLKSLLLSLLNEDHKKHFKGLICSAPSSSSRKLHHHDVLGFSFFFVC